MKCPKCHFVNPADTRFCSNCGTQIIPAGEISDSFTATAKTPIREFTRGSTLAGRYEIIEKLGRGGMGWVYRVVDKTINEEMALKLINPAVASDEKTVERFKNELKFARKITHKNVCRMYDLNESEGNLYITMEYVPGEDLKSMIKMMGQLSIGRTISIAKQVCEGLSEAHRLGVVHRDLKPRNIMIDKEGNARIMDFGIARSLKAEGVTGNGIMIGTPEYMSPEQVSGEKTDQRSDIYALGIILFEMLTGKIPFEGDTSLSIALKQKTDPPPDPREFNAQIPEGLSHIILKCMEKERDKRYQGAEELLSFLGKIEEEISTEERVLPRRKTEELIPRKRLQPFWIAGILFAGILVVVGYLFLGQILQRGEIKRKNHIAVLPFRDFSLQKDQEPLCELMTNEIISKFHMLIPGLNVIPYHTVSRYKDTDKSFKEIGKELDVITILKPRLQKEGNVIRVWADLIDAKDESVIDTFEHDKEFKGVIEVQDAISKSIAAYFKVKLLEEKLIIFKRKEQKNPEAYNYFAKGIHFEKRYRSTYEQKDFENAVKNFEEACAIDRDYALAYYGLGNTYEAHFVKKKDKRDLDSMLNNYKKAYDIDPILPEANVGLGWAYFHKEDWDKAYQYFKSALEIESDSPEINNNVGAFLKSIGLYRKASEFHSKAVELDPLSIKYRKHCARCYMYIGKFKEAARHLKEALEFEPDDMGLRLFYARQLIMMKKYDEAEEEIARAENFDPDNPEIQYPRAFIFAVKGEKEKALAIVREIEKPIYYTYLLSNIYSILGMKDEAIENVKDAIKNGFSEIRTYLYSYPFLIKNHFFDSLRDDYRFKEIVKEEEKKYKEKIRKYGNI